MHIALEFLFRTVVSNKASTSMFKTPTFLFKITVIVFFSGRNERLRGAEKVMPHGIRIEVW